MDECHHLPAVSFERVLAEAKARYVAGVTAAPGIQELYAALAVNDRRNRLILDDVIQVLEQGRSPILLTERKDPLEYFAARLQKFARHLVVLQGGMSAKKRRGVKEQLDAIPYHEERLVLATGRLRRLHPRKTEVRIFDYVDRGVPMLLRMFEKRLRGYRAIGYARGEDGAEWIEAYRQWLGKG